MPTEPIYHKTSKGKAALKSPGNGLSLRERRVLILVNGRLGTAEIASLSLCDDVEAILQSLSKQGFVDLGESEGTTVAARDYALDR